jgi:hypothetical protein
MPLPGTNNFLTFNPNAVNQENDTAYAADTQRSGGLIPNAPLPSSLLNKALFQPTRFAQALAQALANKGFNLSDANLTALITVMSNIITSVDLAAYAPLNSPHLTGSPQAPTQAPGDASANLATTQFLQTALNALAQYSLGLPKGHIKFPLFANFTIQWILGPANPPTGEQTMTLNWDIPFASAVLCVMTSLYTDGINPYSGQDCDANYQVVFWNNTGVGLFLQEYSSGRHIQTQPFVLAIGY